jgi:hypothetical protein
MIIPMVAFISILPSLPVPWLPEMHEGTEIPSTSGEMGS